MKKSLLTILLISFSVFTWAQLSIILPSQQYTPGSVVNIPLKLVGASSSGTPIGGANVQFTYDPAVLTFINLVNFNSATPQSQWFFSGNNGIVAANWLEPNLLTVSIADSAALFEAQFTYIGGTSPLSFTVYEFTDALYNLIPTTPVNGSVSPVPQPFNATFKVDMSRQSVSPEGVHISGSFNGWNPSSTPMVAGADSIFSVTLSLIEGQEYTYRFINGNSISGSESVPSECGVQSPSGYYVRSIFMPSSDTILDTVCFSMCSQCPTDIPVTFRVDMSEQIVNPTGVHLAGSFNSWNTSSIPMTLTTDNVYEVTLMMTPSNFIVYRFVNGNTSAGYESVPDECGSPSSLGGFDRYLIIPDADTTMPAVCFSSCVECNSSATYVNITFRVDMQNESISTEGIHIAGSFQGWQPGLTSMAQTGGGSSYTYTQFFLAGTLIEYKFVNGNTASGYENVPVECALNGNRYLSIPQVDTTLNLVCFSSCDSCAQITTAQVTFRVDMSLSNVSSQGIHLAGNFQGWDPSTTSMNLESDSIYTVTMVLPENTPLEYRFINGDTWNDAEIVPVSCSVNGNRSIEILNDTILDVVCFAKCTSCNVGYESLLSRGDDFWVFPNPATDQIYFKLTSYRYDKLRIDIYDTFGRIVLTGQTGLSSDGVTSYAINVNGLAAGLYFYKVLAISKATEYSFEGKLIKK